jgi:hypothetical protein
LVRGASTDLKRDASGGGEASLAIDYSDLDPAKVSDSGPGSLSQGSHDLNADPRLVNEAGGNFRLRSDSPLVDAGDPAAPAAGDSATDLDGSSRVVDGTGDCSARRDIGAFEFQPGPRAPRAVATAPAKATGSVSFDASASCDPDGNPLAYLWSFDDGQTAAGPVVTHEFATGGRHTGTVTVTDSTGRTDTATASVAFARADHTAPVIHASITRKDFKVGKAATKFRFSLSEKAAVAVKLRQKRGKHLVTRGTLHHAGARGKNSLPFSGRVGGRALAPGSYEAVFTATDAAGNKSKRASVAFRIKNKR